MAVSYHIQAMKMQTLRSEIFLPRPLAEVFDFFADAGNLEALTPDWLTFGILTPAPIAMKTGALIDYRLRVRGIPLRWQSEITAWEPPGRFVDEQRRGPYRRWIHEHRFEARVDGTLVIDSVNYAVWGGWLVDKLFVRRDVEKIFAFRREKLLAHFGPVSPA